MEPTKKLPSEMTDSKLNELLTLAECEMNEWQKFRNALLEEQEKRKESVCEHDLYAYVDYEVRGCWGMHELHWRETDTVMGNYWLETCNHDDQDERCLPKHHETPQPYFKSACRKCKYKEDGIANVNKQKQAM